MRSVLISIRPKWCELIAKGQKTVEVRKTRPKLETPFKVYIYRTKGFIRHLCNGKWWNMPVGGTVIGEFVCDEIREIGFSPYNHGEYTCEDQTYIEQTGLTFDEMFEYLGEGYGYGWHISDLVIYDTPKEWYEFVVPSKTGCVNEGKCNGCVYFDRGNGYNVEDDCNAKFSTDEYKPLKRPPQSWCYVEEVSQP